MPGPNVNYQGIPCSENEIIVYRDTCMAASTVRNRITRKDVGPAAANTTTVSDYQLIVRAELSCQADRKNLTRVSR